MATRRVVQLAAMPQPTGPGVTDAGGRVGRDFAPERQQESVSLFGALVQQYYDIADEDDDREDVNLMNLQYFVSYSLDETSSIVASPNIIADWRQDSDNAYTVPVGIGYSKTVQFGKIPVRFGAEVHYSAIQPDDIPGSEWNFRFYMIPAAPSALFSWMQ